MPNWFVNKRSRYEKSNVIEQRLGGRDVDAGFLLKHTGDHHNYHPSDDGDNSATASEFANDDDNHAHGRRLLTGHRPVACILAIEPLCCKRERLRDLAGGGC